VENVHNNVISKYIRTPYIGNFKSSLMVGEGTRISVTVEVKSNLITAFYRFSREKSSPRNRMTVVIR
jgi:hypothetical protein